MISKKLQYIFLVSIPLFIFHGLEEYFTGFYSIDSFSRFVFQNFEGMDVLQATFLVFQIMIWLLLIVAFLSIIGGRWHLRLMTILGLVFVFELHHIIKVLVSWSYYSGSVTAIPIVVVGFFFWKELVQVLRNSKR